MAGDSPLERLRARKAARASETGRTSIAENLKSNPPRADDRSLQSFFREKLRGPKPRASDNPSHNEYEGRGELVAIEVDNVKVATAVASLCVIDDDEYWIPHSQMFAPGEMLDERGESGTIHIPEWLAQKLGLA